MECETVTEVVEPCWWRWTCWAPTSYLCTASPRSISSCVYRETQTRRTTTPRTTPDQIYLHMTSPTALAPAHRYDVIRDVGLTSGSVMKYKHRWYIYAIFILTLFHCSSIVHEWCYRRSENISAIAIKVFDMYVGLR